MLVLAIKEKNLKFIFCKQWLVTLPIYMVILAYYLILISRYGTINPSLGVIAPEYYKTTAFYNTKVYKPAYPLPVYAKRYWTNFCEYWTGIQFGKSFPKHSLLESIPSMFVFVIPIIYLIYQKIEKEKIDITNASIGIAVIIAVIIQFWKAYYEFLYVSGYLGAYHSRYYVCTMAAFGILLSSIVDKVVTNEKTKWKKVLCGVFVAGYIAILQLGVINI